jgi:hypothetical protein
LPTRTVNRPTLPALLREQILSEGYLFHPQSLSAPTGTAPTRPSGPPICGHKCWKPLECPLCHQKCMLHRVTTQRVGLHSRKGLASARRTIKNTRGPSPSLNSFVFQICPARGAHVTSSLFFFLLPVVVVFRSCLRPHPWKLTYSRVVPSSGDLSSWITIQSRETTTCCSLSYSLRRRNMRSRYGIPLPPFGSSCNCSPSMFTLLSFLPLAFVSATSHPFSHLFPFTAPIERQTYGHTGDRVLHLAWH